MAPSSTSPQPVGIFPQFISTKPETIIFTNPICLANGTPILHIEANSVYSRTYKKKMYDAEGRHLCNLVKSNLHGFTPLIIEDPQGKTVTEVKSGYKLFGSKFTATFTGLNGKVTTLSMKGNAHESHAEIKDETQGGIIVAQIVRETQKMFSKTVTYTMQVPPGVDMALMVAVALAWTGRMSVWT
ncbi:hypothetical protein GQ43DRAFT_443055 [Delitschia confertaspora ATCC 74209]|uniref:Tubby C-terminal-like domain-containing protein n=1 Tax=Delitschia confertaspora ATCC 74209 TaxID=1513339 RepID=A0A9P4JGP1_9PLEO|nr:hypothetical protein GQ43DRAFT_443055 [Delitschia confertaspora ATCC 74209]